MALDVSSLWDQGSPERSEQRFRNALATASGDDALVLQTQIARSYGIRKDFARAQEILASIKDQVKSGSPEIQVRYFLELGRTYPPPKTEGDMQQCPQRNGKSRVNRYHFCSRRHF